MHEWYHVCTPLQAPYRLAGTIMWVKNSAQSPTLPFTTYLTVGKLKLLKTSLSLCLICKTGIKKTNSIEVLWGWNAIIYVENMPHCLAYSKCSTTIIMVMIVWESLVNMTNTPPSCLLLGLRGGTAGSSLPHIYLTSYPAASFSPCPSSPQVQSQWTDFCG